MKNQTKRTSKNGKNMRVTEINASELIPGKNPNRLGSHRAKYHSDDRTRMYLQRAEQLLKEISEGVKNRHAYYGTMDAQELFEIVKELEYINDSIQGTGEFAE